MTHPLLPASRAATGTVAVACAAVLLIGCMGFTSASPAQDAEVKLDVPYVPTPDEVVDLMLDLGQVKEGDYVIDLGSGDGRIVIAAARHRNARGLGVDIDPERIAEAEANAAAAGVADRVEFRRQNLFETDLSKADVITMYLLARVNLELRPRLLEQTRPGTRVVSHSFSMGDWEPDAHERVSGRHVYMWVVPAPVDGTWNIADGERNFTVSLTQNFQKVHGHAEVDGQKIALENVRLEGDRIEFALDEGTGLRRYVGRVVGDRMRASSVAAGDGRAELASGWTASRQS